LRATFGVLVAGLLLLNTALAVLVRVFSRQKAVNIALNAPAPD